MNLSNMAKALADRDAGMASSANHAETDAPGWGHRAYECVRLVARFTGKDWTVEEMRGVCYACGLDVPAESRAWGSVTQRLIRDGIIEPVGYASASSSNGSPKRTYRLVR